MKIHITLWYGSMERTFFVTCDRDTCTFQWLAKVVFQRYTIFVPDVDKVAPPHMKLHAEPTKDISICPNTFSPPVEASISDYVMEGDMILCRLENNDHSGDVLIQFFLKHTGKTSGRKYSVLSSKKQQELRSDIKSDRFHQFQVENQKKLSQFISKQTQLLASTGGAAPPGLRPRPPSFEAYRHSQVSSKFRRRAIEKASLQADNQPVYDFDPADQEEEENLALSPGSGNEGEAQTEAPGQALRRMSSRRISTSLSLSRKTGVRNTILELFRQKSLESSGDKVNAHTVITEDMVPSKESGKPHHLIKPNGPISKDVLWRHRALKSGALKSVSAPSGGILAKSPVPELTSRHRKKIVRASSELPDIQESD